MVPLITCVGREGMAKSVSLSLPGSTSDSGTYKRERVVDAETDEDDQSICYSR